MESTSNWTECSESGCSQVTRERKCASCHTNKVVQLSWAQAMPCPQCDQVFLSPRALKDHLHLLHWGRLVNLCDHCGETFFHSEQLKRHKNSSHSSIVEEIIEIPMELKSLEKVETAKEEEDTNILDNNSWTSNNAAIDELLSKIGQGNLANFTRAYIGSVRKHLDFKHQEYFTDCLDCFAEDPLSVLFAGKASNLQPFHGQDNTFDQLWRRNALSKGDEEKLVKFENGNLNNGLNSGVKEAVLERREGAEEYFENDEEGMDVGESDAEDEDLADFDDDELEATNTALGKDLVDKTVDGIIEKEIKETEEDKIDPCKKSLGNVNMSNKAPLRRRLYGF